MIEPTEREKYWPDGQKEWEWQHIRFCSSAVGEALGACVQGQHLYLVQTLKISVYEYHGNFQKPELSEEFIYNKPILAYSINSFYICIRSSSLLEIRDRRHWQQVIYTLPIYEDSPVPLVMLSGQYLYFSQLLPGDLVFQRIDLKNDQTKEQINLGKMEAHECLSLIPPIFLKQLGMLQEFYIFPKNLQQIELGMLYTGNDNSKRKFEVGQISIKEGQIKKMYHHQLACSKYPHQSLQYVILLVELPSSQLSLELCEIVPKNNRCDTRSGLEGIVGQFSFFSKIGQESASSSLVQQVFNEAMSEPTRRSQISLPLDMSQLEWASMEQGRILISSKDQICVIQLNIEDSIENILSHQSLQHKLIKSKSLTEKPKGRKLVGVYKNHFLFTQPTICFDLAFARGPSPEEIPQEIEINDQILDEQDNTEERIQKQIIDLVLSQEEDKGQISPMKVMIDYSTQTQSKTKEISYGTQTSQNAIQQIKLQEIQSLVAKYSSNITASCTKIKQNNFIKDKFDREITNIVDSTVRQTILPHLGAQFQTLFDQQLKIISQRITEYFQAQLDALNMNMRKVQTKQSNTRAHRLFDFSNQVLNIKQTTNKVTDALRQTETSRYAVNELILEEARQLKETMGRVEQAILEIDSRAIQNEKELDTQIGEILELVRKLDEKEGGDDGQNSSEGTVSEEVVDQASEESDKSEESEEFQDEEVQMQYPQHFIPVKGQRQSKRRYFLPQGQGQGYPQYPSDRYPPPQMPNYFYPFLPQIPPYPYSYYPPPSNQAPPPTSLHKKKSKKLHQ